jgi:uncharacterized protein (DUF2235 family)
MEEFEPGDNVFLFGFSRGAYTARALAAMLHMFGLIKRGDDVLVPYVMKLFKRKIRDRHGFDVAHRFKATFSHECKPHFLGVWDTVSSVGWIHNPLTLPYTAHNPDIAVCRHALSVDERRYNFRQNVWQPVGNQDSKQVWFPGVHSDVGGGYPESESGLSKIALRWMVQEAEVAGLHVDAGRKAALLGGTAPNVSPDAAAMIHQSLRRLWWVLEFVPRRPWDMRFNPPVRRLTIPRGSRRFIAQPATLHQSVFDRKRQVAGYDPSNLPATYSVEP